MAYVIISNKLIKDAPDIVNCLEENFTNIVEVDSTIEDSRKWILKREDLPTESIPVYITFGRKNNKVIISDIDIF